MLPTDLVWVAEPGWQVCKAFQCYQVCLFCVCVGSLSILWHRQRPVLQVYWQLWIVHLCVSLSLSLYSCLFLCVGYVINWRLCLHLDLKIAGNRLVHLEKQIVGWTLKATELFHWPRAPTVFKAVDDLALVASTVQQTPSVMTSGPASTTQGDTISCHKNMSTPDEN